MFSRRSKVTKLVVKLQIGAPRLPQNAHLPKNAYLPHDADLPQRSQSLYDMSLTPLDEISCITPHSTEPNTLKQQRESDTFSHMTGEYR